MVTALVNAAVFGASFYWLWLMSVIGAGEGAAPDIFRLTLFWLAVNAAVYTANRVFLREARSMPALAFVNLILYVLQIAGLMFFFSEFREITQYNILAWALIFGTTVFTVLCCLSQSGPSRIRLFFEFSVIYLIIFLFVQAGDGFRVIYSLPVFFTVLLNLACLFHLRINAGKPGSGDSARKAGTLIPIAVIIPVFAVLAYILLSFVGPLGDGLNTLLNGLIAALVFAARLIAKPLTWLADILMKNEPGAEPEPEPGQEPGQEPDPDPDPAPDFSLPGTVIFLVFMAGMTVYLLYRMRKWRFKTGGSSVLSARKSRAGFFDALKALCREIRARLCFFAVSLARRSTPQGVYLRMERLGARNKLFRAKGETHTHYLERWKHLALRQNKQDLAGLISKLQQDLQGKFYGKSAVAFISQEELLFLRKNMRFIFAKEEKRVRKKHLCPVCEEHGFSQEGSYEICPVCGWEDDRLQLKNPDYESGANRMSLNRARKAYAEGKKVWRTS